ncbi:MAG: hypothetical protein M3R03_10235 [Pseudomonadota bacterium]|nr:hypothetical protein [Pseudomonadota bacterium]
MSAACQQLDGAARWAMSLSDVSRLLSDAQWLTHRYDPEQDAFQYRHVQRSQHRSVPFLTDECLGAEPVPVVVGSSEAVALAPPPAPIHFIFHSAYCASTMLLRALDVSGSAMGLSEPVILNDLIGWQRRGADPGRLGAVLDGVLGQLARPFAPGEAVVVKPSNVFNGLAMRTMALRPESRAVLLYSPLPEFLLSVARKGLWCRLWTRELLEGLLQDGLVDLGFEPRDYFRQSDLQVAAVGWLAQQALFGQLARQFGQARIAALDSETLTKDPSAAVAKAARHLGLPAASYEAHPAYARNSKSGKNFAAGERQDDQTRTRQAHGDEIDMVVSWANAVAQNAGVATALPNPLR